MKALIVVDYQNDFVDGALGFKGAETIEQEIIRLVKEFKNNGDVVIFTKDTHETCYLETVEGNHLPVPHCIRGSDGHQITKELLKEVGDSEVIEKPTFPSLELGNRLAKLNPSEIHLCGLVSDMCVFSNAIIAKAACPNSEIYMRRKASESFDHNMQEKTYEVAAHLHINVID